MEPIPPAEEPIDPKDNLPATPDEPLGIDQALLDSVIAAIELAERLPMNIYINRAYKVVDKLPDQYLYTSEYPMNGNSMFNLDKYFEYD